MARSKIAEPGKNGIVDMEWRSGRYTVGLVLVKTTAGYKAYIGPAMDISPERDAEFIVHWGALLSREEAEAFFPQIKDKEVNYNGDRQKRSGESSRR